MYINIFFCLVKNIINITLLVYWYWTISKDVYIFFCFVYLFFFSFVNYDLCFIYVQMPKIGFTISPTTFILLEVFMLLSFVIIHIPILYNLLGWIKKYFLCCSVLLKIDKFGYRLYVWCGEFVILLHIMFI